MRTVTVVGAGFAGLTVAHELLRRGFQVEVHERFEQPGGLLGSMETPYGLVETAANALLANDDIENLFAEVGVDFAERFSSRRRRYVFWEKPRRWPLSARTSARLLWGLARLGLGHAEVMPTAQESIREWGERLAGREFVDRLLSPALQGVYAGDDSQLSAALILRHMLSGHSRRGSFKGSVAPRAGMGELMSALTNSLSERGAEIHFESRFEIPEVITTPIVLATSAWQASELLKSARPKLATKLAHVESLPLLSVTCFFKHGNKDLRGFGCLFPRRQKFHSLGVLFNDCIFAGRARAGIRSETWILGGAHNRDIAAVSDDEILRRILQDRGRLGGDDVPPLDYKIQRWTRALPHYTCDWAKHLEDVHDDPPIYLHGNYLGEIGLSRIYARSIRLAVQLKASYG